MLYLVLLQYRAPLDAVEKHLDAHRSYLQDHYAAGHFLLSGPQDPRTGGLILVTASSRDDVNQWITEDPFHRANIADYTIIGWRPTLRSALVPASLAPEAHEP